MSKKKIYRELCLLFSIISIRLFSLSKPLSSISKFIICRLTLLPDKLIHSHGSPGQHHHHRRWSSYRKTGNRKKNIYIPYSFPGLISYFFPFPSLTHSLTNRYYQDVTSSNSDNTEPETRVLYASDSLLLLLQSRLTPSHTCPLPHLLLSPQSPEFSPSPSTC